MLVVGAAATGAQLADEIQRSGRPVTLAVGEHVRACRTYRGRDMQWWMDATGLNDERYDEVENLTRARSLPSFSERTTPLDVIVPLGSLTMGERDRALDEIGRFRDAGATGMTAGFRSNSLAEHLECLEWFAREIMLPLSIRAQRGI